MIQTALMAERPIELVSNLDPSEMLEHLVLRILVGSHRRNMKLLEILQGAEVLSIKRWHVHTYVSASKL